MAPHLPVLGEYFVFKLNPSQTLNLILDDPEVAAACEALGARCKKYIGCCIGWTGVPSVGSLFPFEMSMVSRGLSAYPKGFVTKDMSLPILPTTHHPRGRKPVIVDPPLPWDDCYHCSLALMIVRVLYRERDVRPRGKYALVPCQQTAILKSQETDDGKWRQKLLDMDKTGGTDFEPDPIEEQEAIEAFYELLKTEPDMNLQSRETVVGDLDDTGLNDDPLMDLDPPGESDVITSSDYEGTEDSISQSSSYDSFREEMAHQFDYSPALDLALDLEVVSVEELADDMFDFYEELLEMGEILLAHRAKVAAALADVQRQDAEFDAKVAAARQSSSIVKEGQGLRETSENVDMEHSQNAAEVEECIHPHCAPIEVKMESPRSSTISPPSNHQPGNACASPEGVAGAISTTTTAVNGSVSSTSILPSTPEDTKSPRPRRGCWRSVTQYVKSACSQTIKATRRTWRHLLQPMC